ncbi:hypothetical protein UFOVP324_39 [uncultured Caudovirales phage]|uniref:Uncharacterized protein n=1 Tax=uncultured Caudovirales phage TaxID=2100421 RepID=A0A6J5LWM7_9CAUD|nr:hypothetical protein UFOVP324_39 [uncultured Caudovirales phage]
MEFNLNSAYRFTWEDHLKADWEGFARTFNQIKEFDSQEQAQEYIKNMLAGNMCIGVIELNDAYDQALYSGDGDTIEEFVSKNTFTI